MNCTKACLRCCEIRKVSDRILAALAKSFADLRDRVAALAREPGPAGKDGAPGVTGPAGKDGERGPSGLDGRAGVDGADGRPGSDGKDGQPGATGPAGKDGEPGPTGPMPKHEWRGTELRFQKDPNTWGKWVDLRGPASSSSLAVLQSAGGIENTTYTHEQDLPAATWTVTHNLGRHPSITVVDNLGGQLYPDVRYVDADIAQITHSVPLTGRAYCN